MKLKLYQYTIRAKETFVCPICKWRVTQGNDVPARTMMREHLKREHMIIGHRIKLLKPL